MVQWIRICLPMQGTRVRSLVREDPVRRACPRLRLRSGAREPRLLGPACLEPVPRGRGGPRSERPAHRDGEWPPLAAAGEGPNTAQNKNIYKYINQIKKKRQH